ncbi:PAS domain S-box-containing protein/diguanylate cyclase (GGDEF) domain-containing protein [Roseomonas rosea]|uniref:PAS domain S-box-containing protein/diguanylate cyclase (GGDEF) domain-containing protein n=2 Tax=Muricoccus roseus TaxID=198092 RepID=A0A1M6AFC7_9PROT|nr:PAS domain S-box-containing protein/diguanylate cyclase (GGDEF) domain-containing protein [Roseomonas rosea]
MRRSTSPSQGPAQVGLCVMDRTLRVIRVNRSFTEVIGRPSAVGRSLSELAPGLALGLQAQIGQALREEPGGAAEIAGEALGPDGAGRVFLASVEPLDGQGGELILLLRDVTEERAVEASLAESEAAFRRLFHSNPAPMWVYDRETLRFLEVNEAALEAYGWSREALLGMSILDIRPPEERDTVRRSAAEPRSARKVSGPWRHLDASGRERLVHAVSYLMEFGGRPGVLVTAWDVTDRVRAEAALRESEDFARGILESTTDCMKVLDLEGRLLFLNGAGLALLDVDDFEAIRGREWMSLLPAETAAEAGPAIAAALAGGTGRFTGFCPTLKGVPKWWDVIVSPILGASGEVARLLSISRDVTERRAAERQISYLAHHDPLTELPNRRLFHRRLEQAMAAPEQGGRMALHCIDLDGFKIVNDTLGHVVGDALLRLAAERLGGCLRGGDMVARTGGDEFAVLQTGLRGPEDAEAFARRIVALLNEDYEIDGRSVHAGSSVGIALSPEDGTTPDALLRNADIALCRAKADGRGVFRFFERQMDEAVQRKQALKAGLRGALDRAELELRYQPLIGVEQGGITCFEALMRWRHPHLGMVPPAEFIPVAEESGFITGMGEWALATACREAASWPAPLRLAVNLSPVQFRRPGLVRAVAMALSDSGLMPERLELEITESVLLGEEEANLAILRQLRDLGVRIALDDFGTGFSSLGYLLRFPFDKIKIDRSFVHGLPDREDAKAIVRAITGMGRGLGISVTAEGVETPGQLGALRKKGCSEAQGYLFSPPVPASEIPALFKRLRPSSHMAA